MAGENKIILTVDGAEKNQHRLDFSTFVEKIKRFGELLKCTAQVAAKETGEQVEFDVGKITRLNPVRMETVPVARKELAATVAVSLFAKNMDLVDQGITEGVAHSVLLAMKDVANYNKKDFSRTVIQVIASDYTKHDHAYTLDDQWVKVLTRACDGRACISTVDGKLDQINIHSNPYTCKVYPRLLKSSPITCKFDGDLLQKVRGLLGTFVSVRGECLYRAGKAYPHEMKLRKIEKLPSGDDAPTWQDIYGIAPNITGGLSSEEFIRRQRNEWDR